MTDRRRPGPEGRQPIAPPPAAPEAAVASILEQIFSLLDREQRAGCTNKVILGGIDLFVARQLARLAPLARPEQRDLLDQFNFPLYQSTPSDEREGWLRDLRSWLGEAVVGGRGPGAGGRGSGAGGQGSGNGGQGSGNGGQSRRSDAPVIAAPRSSFSGESSQSRSGETPLAVARRTSAVKGKGTLTPALSPAGERELDAADQTVRGDQAVRGDQPVAPTKRSTPIQPSAFSLQPSSDLDRPIRTLKGFDAKVAPKFDRLGIVTVRDLLFMFPHRHVDRRSVQTIANLQPGPDETVQGVVWDIGERTIGPGRKMVEATIGDETGTMRATWFNQPWLVRQLRPGTPVLLAGKVDIFKGRPSLTVQDYEILAGDDFIHAGRLVPVYPLTEGLAQRTVRRLVKPIVDRYAGLVGDPLPESIRKGAELIDRPLAVATMHFPDRPEDLDLARRRLAFDELLLVQLGLLNQKRDWQTSAGAELIGVDQNDLRSWISRLPFELTDAQTRAVDRIMADIGRDQAMARLLQGDVGSGKTVVAALALAAAVAAGGQGAILAPTEILANQHYLTLSRLLAAILPGVRVELLTGSTRAKERRELLTALQAGLVNVLVGTHAVIQEGVIFRRLLLGVVDEQHRFGVAQRAALRQKGEQGRLNPHMLVMTATPIPRTLALTVYGDMDLTVLDELPPGRQPITTRFVGPDKRDRAYHWIRDEVTKGRQAFVICPLVEESEKLDARAATVEFERLTTVFPDLRLGLLHGRLKAKEKEETMVQFRDGTIDILVSTAVVEVGIDVPNATIMLIEGAERFGLAQLHQFRGRVGRGAEQSYCLLLSDAANGESRERLRIVERTHDGFRLAEEDLRLRGPGEFFGVRQSGLPELRLAQLSDTALVEQAREVASELFQVDPDLSQPEHAPIRAEVQRIWQPGAGDRS